MTTHTSCDHVATPAARSSCRKARLAAELAHVARRAYVLDQLSGNLGSTMLLARVCIRYSGYVAGGENVHANHVTTHHCADSIIRAIDAFAVRDSFRVDEANLRSHALRMFS